MIYTTKHCAEGQSLFFNKPKVKFNTNPTMDKFVLKRPNESDRDTNNNNKCARNDHQSSTKTSMSSPSSKQTAALKTVKKWEMELGLSLDYEVCKIDSNQVVQIWRTICRQYARDRTSSFVKGNRVVKKEGVVYHKKSITHQVALRAKDASEKKADGRPTDIESSFQKMDIQLQTKMIQLFNIAYYLAIEERPFSVFPKLVNLHKKNSLDLGVTYSNDMSSKLFTSEIASFYFDV